MMLLVITVFLPVFAQEYIKVCFNNVEYETTIPIYLETPGPDQERPEMFIQGAIKSSDKPCISASHISIYKNGFE